MRNISGGVSPLPEFHGSTQLAHAACEVLGNSMNGAVIRGVVSVDFVEKVIQAEDAVATLYTSNPAFTELDETVEEWTRANMHLVPRGVDTHTKPSFINSSMGARWHIDDKTIVSKGGKVDALPGPFTVSVRLDKTIAPRRFCLARVPCISVRPNGILDPEFQDAYGDFLFPGKAHLATRRYQELEISITEQRCGDVVLIPNHPLPALHRVKSRSHRTSALVYDYLLK